MFVQRFDTNYNGLLGPAVLESARVLSRRVVVLALRNISCALRDWQKLLHSRINVSCECIDLFNGSMKRNDMMLVNNTWRRNGTNRSWPDLEHYKSICIRRVGPWYPPEKLLLEPSFGAQRKQR